VAVQNKWSTLSEGVYGDIRLFGGELVLRRAFVRAISVLLLFL
jgi:hypothetical protein